MNNSRSPSLLLLFFVTLLAGTAWCQDESSSFNVDNKTTASSENLYTYDDIVKEMNKVTDEYLEEIIKMRNLVPDTPLFDYQDLDDNVEPARRRRKRDTRDQFIPDFIRDGIQLISKILPIKRRLCEDKGKVVDFAVVKFNREQYVVCLVKDPMANFVLHYGPIWHEHDSTPLSNMKQPRKVLAFVVQKSNVEELVVLVVNSKKSVGEFAVKWLQINAKNELTYENHLKDLSRVSTRNLALWERKNMLIVHDLFESSLKLFTFVGTYFDPETPIKVSDDLNSMCAFTFQGVPYLVLGYRSSIEGKSPRDLVMLKYNQHSSKQLEKIQSIQCANDVVDIKYFTIGYGTNQENFLVIVERNHIVLYKFLKSTREFIVFQRIEARGVREVITYGDAKRMFVMGVVLESNDVAFITYNSLRFIFSNINIRVFPMPQQPIYFHRLITNEDSMVQMMIGGNDGIRLHSIEFYHDNNLFRIWTEHLNWCRQKRTEVAELERRNTLVSKRFSESYLKNEPLMIKGNITVPTYEGNVEAQGYQVRSNKPDSDFFLNDRYFHDLNSMEKRLRQLDRQILRTHARLSDAVLLNSNQIQTIKARHVFANMRIIRYTGNRAEEDSGLILPSTMNLITEQLNRMPIKDLFDETVAIRNISPTGVRLLQEMHFQTVEIASNYMLEVKGLTNGFNLSDIVTANGNHHITGEKTFHTTLMVDDKMQCTSLNGLKFSRDHVLLTEGDQVLTKPVLIQNELLRTRTLNAQRVNHIDMNHFLSSAVRKNEPIHLSMPLEFANGLEVYDLVINGSGRLNGENIDQLFNEVLWVNQPNQTVFSECFFNASVHIEGNLWVNRINNKNIPNDLLLINQMNVIQGRKTFRDPVFIHKLNVTSSLNGLKVINGIPDIVLRHIPQNITGRKVFQNIYLQNNSFIGGRLNSMSLAELDRRSKERPKMRYYKQLYIDNLANFQGGLWFEQLNTISRSQFNQLMEESLSLNEQWTNVNFDHLQFDDLEVYTLDCDKINGLNLESDLLTRTTPQSIVSPLKVHEIVIEAPSYALAINNRSMSSFADILQTAGDQTLTDVKVINGDVRVDTLRTNFINGVPFEDIVFMDDINSQKVITGPKHFRAHKLMFEHMSVEDLHVKSINRVDLREMLQTSLRKFSPQTVPHYITFDALRVDTGDHFVTEKVNHWNLNQLKEDVVYVSGETRLQNVTGIKVFLGDAKFTAIEFDRFFDGVTFWEMRHNWMVQNSEQHVFANFSMDHLTVLGNVSLHDVTLNGVNLDWLDDNVVRLDRKTVVHSQLEFFGNTKVYGNLLLNGRLNQVDLRKDIVLANHDRIQTIRGRITLLGNVSIERDLDVNGLLNGINIAEMCSRAYRRDQAGPLVISGNAAMLAPATFATINGIHFKELLLDTMRHNQNNQQVLGTQIIDTLVLNGVTEVKRYVNGLNLDLLFQNYMSITQNQDVEANVVLRYDQYFDDDIWVRDYFGTASGVVGGVNLTHIDQTALRIYGNQEYHGNIHFVTDVNVDWNLNSRWINGFDTQYLMHKKRSTNVFREEITFTESIQVVNNTNIIKGRRVDGVNVNSMLKNAVLRNSGRNYTIHGTKEFDSIDVVILHTRPINNVVFTRENLLLTNYDQVIAGEKHFGDDMVINTSLVVRAIDDIPVNQLNRRLVKKNKDNVIKSKVRVRDLNVNTASVNALIDNVDISVLNTISEQVKQMHHLEREVKNAESRFSLFERNLRSIAAKLVFYDHFSSITSVELEMPLSKPLYFTSMLNTFFLFMSASSEDGCNMVVLFTRPTVSNSSASGEWHLHSTLYTSGKVLSILHSEHNFILSSQVQQVPTEHMAKCLMKNHRVNQNAIAPQQGSVLVQVFHFFLQQKTLYQTGYEIFKPPVTKFRVNLIRSRPLLLSIQVANRLYLLPVRLSDPNTPSQLPLSKPLLFDDPIHSVSNFRKTMLVVTTDRATERTLLHIFRLKMDLTGLTQVQTISLHQPGKVLLLEAGSQHSEELILVTESLPFTSSTLIRVFGTTDGVQFALMQEIDLLGSAKSLKAVYSRLGMADPYVLVEIDARLDIYRRAGLQGLVYYGSVRSPVPPFSVMLSSNQPDHYLALYFASQCDTDDENAKIEILRPRYRQEVNFGSELSLHESTHLYRNTSSHTL